MESLKTGDDGDKFHQLQPPNYCLLEFYIMLNFVIADFVMSRAH